MKIVISQPMYFPWVGLLEQIKLADKFVFYDDVQYSKGFINRVQIKTKSGLDWISIPLRSHNRNTLINQIKIDNSTSWQTKHLKALRHAYASAPYFKEMFEIASEILENSYENLFEITSKSIFVLNKYFDLKEPAVFYRSSELNIDGSGSRRLLEICKFFNANVYITGLGALNYLDEQIFSDNGIDVQVMDYQKISYSQLNGEFIPYVSSLDLIANCGSNGKNKINSKTKKWRQSVR